MPIDKLNHLSATTQSTEVFAHLLRQHIDVNTHNLTWQKTEQVHTEEPV